MCAPGRGGEFVDAFGLGYNPVAAISAIPGGPPPFEGWPVFGTPHGLDPTAVPASIRVVKIDGVSAPCNGLASTTPVGTGVCIDGQTVAVPSPVPTMAAPNGHDLVFAVDRYGRIAFVDPIAGGGVLTGFTLPLASPAKRVRDLFVTDLDGDGALDVVATFEGDRIGTGSVWTCALDASAHPDPARCHDVLTTVKAVSSSVTSCAAAAVGQFGAIGPTTGARTDQDLVVVCTDDAGTAAYRIAGGTASVLRAGLPDEPALLRSGDIDGDGVTDLVFVYGPPGAQTLSVLRQCASRDTASCQEAP